MIRIKPADGVRVRDPGHGFALVPAGGVTVELDAHWQRQIDAGDVVVVEPEPEPEPVKREAKK